MRLNVRAEALTYLALALLMLRVLADHPHHTAAMDDLALVTNLLYRCTYLHNDKPLNLSTRKLGAPSRTRLYQPAS